MNKTEILRVLFIGNSYTGVGRLYELVPAMVNDGPSKYRMEGDRSISGGKDLKYHWEHGEALAKIQTGRFDYVVLQNNSRTALEEDRRVRAPGYTAKFVDAIRKHGAEPVIYGTWARKDQPEKQPDITAYLRTLAQQHRVKIAPAGTAWMLSLQQRPDLILHCADKSHPLDTGVYMNACVLYMTLTGESPVGHSTRSVTMQKRHPESGKRIPHTITVTFDEETALHIQRTAEVAVRQYQ